MYCPRCAAQIADETNFCKKCGLTLRPVADALQLRTATTEEFDWSKTWVGDMFLSDDERLRRRAAAATADSVEGNTFVEMKRAREVKGGIITSSVGIGLSIFLWFFLGALADVVEAKDPAAAVVLRHVWAAGIIPFVVGLGISLSAIFVNADSLRRSQATVRSLQSRLAGGSRSGKRTTSELPALDAPPPVASVTEHTTDLLVEPAAGQRGAAGEQRVTQ
jgi:zinc ribbon protein